MVTWVWVTGVDSGNGALSPVVGTILCGGTYRIDKDPLNRSDERT